MTMDRDGEATACRLPVDASFVGVRVRVGGVLVRVGTVVLGRSRVRLRLLMLPFGVVVRRLVVMVGCGGVVRGRLEVVLGGGMLVLLGHDAILGLERGTGISRMSACDLSGSSRPVDSKTHRNRPIDTVLANSSPIDARRREKGPTGLPEDRRRMPVAFGGTAPQWRTVPTRFHFADAFSLLIISSITKNSLASGPKPYWRWISLRPSSSSREIVFDRRGSLPSGSIDLA